MRWSSPRTEGRCSPVALMAAFVRGPAAAGKRLRSTLNAFKPLCTRSRFLARGCSAPRATALCACGTPWTARAKLNWNLVQGPLWPWLVQAQQSLCPSLASCLCGAALRRLRSRTHYAALVWRVVHWRSPPMARCSSREAPTDESLAGALHKTSAAGFKAAIRWERTTPQFCHWRCLPTARACSRRVATESCALGLFGVMVSAYSKLQMRSWRRGKLPAVAASARLQLQACVQALPLPLQAGTTGRCVLGQLRLTRRAQGVRL